MSDLNCSIGITIRKEPEMKPKMTQPVSDEKWYEFWVSVLKKAVEKKKEAKNG